jgi:hypothetical protein
MELESLFSTSKWIILKLLSAGSKSPLELAQLSQTSLANVSQQLRLLELGGFVVRKRISNRDKGKPRILYSLRGDYAFVIVGMEGFAAKKALSLSAIQKSMLRIWFLENKEIQYFLERIVWTLEPDLEKIKLIQYNPQSVLDIDLRIISDSSEFKKHLKEYTIAHNGIVKKIKFTFIKDSSSDLYTIYDGEAQLKKNNPGHGEVEA